MEKIITGDRQTGKTRILIEDYVDHLRSGEKVAIIASDQSHAKYIYNEIKELLGDEYNRYKDHINVYIPPKMPPMFSDKKLYIDNIDRIFANACEATIDNCKTIIKENAKWS